MNSTDCLSRTIRRERRHLHVRPLRHGGGHAGRAHARRSTPYLKAKGWTGEPARLVTWWRRTHFENSMIDALLRPGAHPVPRDRAHFALLHAGARRHPAHAGGSEAAGLRDRAPAALPGRRGGAEPAQAAVPPRDPLQRRPRHAGGDQAPSRHRLRPHHLGRRGRPLQAARGDLSQGSGDHGARGPEEILFVANHAFDCVGAKASGMRTAFIDRRKRPFGDWPYQPDLVVGDFKELADALA